MTAPARSFETELGRFYRHPLAPVPRSALGRAVLLDDEGPYRPQPSITTVMKTYDEGFLPGYHGKLIAEYAIENLEALNEAVQSTSAAEAVGILRAVPEAPHPNSAIGDEVHAAIDAHHEGLPIPPLTTVTARNDFAQYLYFLSVFSPRVLRTEYTVWSNLYGYAGTGDAIWHDAATGHWAIDYKSGTRVYPKTGMQLAASQRAEFLLNKAKTGMGPMPPIENLGILHIRPMSIKLYRVERPDACWQAFLACRTLFEWKRTWAAGVIPEEPFLRTERPKEAKKQHVRVQ